MIGTRRGPPLSVGRFRRCPERPQTLRLGGVLGMQEGEKHAAQTNIEAKKEAPAYCYAAEASLTLHHVGRGAGMTTGVLIGI